MLVNLYGEICVFFVFFYLVSMLCFKFFNIKRIVFEIVLCILGKLCEIMVNWKYIGERRILLVKVGNEISLIEILEKLCLLRCENFGNF